MSSEYRTSIWLSFLSKDVEEGGRVDWEAGEIGDGERGREEEEEEEEEEDERDEGE